MPDLRKPDSEAKFPYLEYYPEQGAARQRILIDRSPFRIGRSKGAHYIIYSNQVSKEHAELICAGEVVRIRDLGSTNGTFVNGQRIAESKLANGDILHFAHQEFRFVHEAAGPPSRSEFSITELAKSGLPASLIRAGKHLREMIAQRSVRIVFQPIVHLDTCETLGYEALGRSNHPELSLNPSELFALADLCKLAPELSRMLRSVAVKEAVHLPPAAHVFLNLHPSETMDEDLINSLHEIRSAFRDDQKPVLEVHEDIGLDLRTLLWLRERLHQLGIGLAYDDFGAGQARLAELAEVPPDFVKLDTGLIRGIDTAEARQALVQALNRWITGHGVELIAEGVETLEEANACRKLGCRFAQGYLFGRPQSAALLGRE